MGKLNIKEIGEKNLFLYRYIRGSTLYGTALPPDENGKLQSDIDEGGVYLAPIEHIIGLGFDYQDEVKDEKGDLSYYELKKYLHLLINSNPNILESLFIPDKFIIGEVHPLMKKIISNRDAFVSKKCFDSFLGYAYTQIKKARGLNKKVFKPIVERKDVLDFCYTFHENGSINIKNFLNKNGLKQEYCGLTAINNMHEMYHLYYDWGNHRLNEMKNNPVEYNKDFIYKFQSIYRDRFKHLHFDTEEEILNLMPEPIGYAGIVGTDGYSNEVRLSSIPKGEYAICQISFNKNGYSSHCKDYREFKEWEKNRNPVRYENTIKQGKGYDCKNLCHCIRLMHMSKELAEGKGFNVVRTWDKDMLMNIRLGKMEYDYLINYAEKLKTDVEELIPTCPLPDTVNVDIVNNILIEIRKEQFF
jgi:hypothetical protein